MQQICDIAEATIVQARKLKASKATFQALEASPAIRKVLFGLPLDNCPAPTTDNVVQFYFGALSPIPKIINTLSCTFTPIEKNKDKREDEHKQRRDYVTRLFMNGPMGQLFQYFPLLSTHKLHQSISFYQKIIGDKILSSGGPFDAQDIIYRLGVAHKAIKDNAKTHENNYAQFGSEWVNRLTGGQEALIEIQKGVPEFLRWLAKEGYLDKLAGVVISDGHLPRKEQRINGVVLQRGKDGEKKDASTIVTWDYPLSPAFIEFATT
jgi:hypothetical protein